MLFRSKMPGTHQMSGKGKGKSNQEKGGGSKRRRSGLVVPLAPFNSRRAKTRQSPMAQIALGAIAEWAAAELVEVAGNAARDNRQRRIQRKYVGLAVDADRDLKRLFRDCVIPGGGKQAEFDARLLPSKNKRRRKKSMGKKKAPSRGSGQEEEEGHSD